jgi:hypothetical protein
MIEIYIDRDNCNSLYFDTNNDINYTRVINNKIYNVKLRVDDLFATLHTLSTCTDDYFIMLSKLNHCTIEVD